jgi:hypothetical protein
MPDNITGFVRRKSSIDRYREIMKPDFDFLLRGPDVNVRGFASFIRIEERPKRAPP